ncbi:hypothetical protein AVEN_181696-1 [Araneus ventricosus]|uniref:DUF7041 domain-containing protein n=1 Tax=Araneus ventricosus TaxID=182803 RepID=A0A4Y2Q445_ARAVE|nr:hypothetical protein AVEN_181696-1 [Araneus ventricosus]
MCFLLCSMCILLVSLQSASVLQNPSLPCIVTSTEDDYIFGDDYTSRYFPTLAVFLTLAVCVFTSSLLLNMTKTEEDSTPELGRVAFEVPPLWKSNPEFWLLQFESQFVTDGISKECTKFNCVVSVLG